MDNATEYVVPANLRPLIVSRGIGSCETCGREANLYSLGDASECARCLRQGLDL